MIILGLYPLLKFSVVFLLQLTNLCVHDIHAHYMHVHSHIYSSYLCSQYRTIPTRLLSLLMEVSHLLSSPTTVGNWSGQEMPPLATTLQDNCMTAIHSQGQRKLRTLPA